jgi:hypothetical protein
MTARCWSLSPANFRCLAGRHEHDDEFERLHAICGAERERLRREVMQQIQRALTRDEGKMIWDAVGTMPEHQEHDRLIRLNDQHFDRMWELIGQMWPSRRALRPVC